MGHQVNPPAPITALADMVNGIINGSTAIFEMGRTGAVMERLVIEKFANLLGLADTTGGFLTNGGTLANLTALLAARTAKWPSGDAWSGGNQAFRPCVLVNEQAHYCIDRAVKIMGWGEAGIINAWIGFIFGMAGWGFILYEIFMGEAGSVSGGVSAHVKSAFDTMRFIVTVGWSIYPLGYFFGYLLGSVDDKALNLVYNLADFINKIAF